jgi:hypothetical protein
MLKFSSFFILLFSLESFGADKLLRYENYVYEDRIETVILSKSEQIYNPMAVIRLNSAEQLTLVFDELKTNNSFYQYTYVHCDAGWNPSNMQPTEYLSGNLMENFSQFSFSSNTYQKYVHYKMTFPTRDMKITRSGNYLLKVFRDFDESDLILTRRFMVMDERTVLTGKVSAASHPAYRFSKHEIDFNASYKNYKIPNPFTDVNAVIMQNNNWQTAIFGLKPLFVNNDELIFNYEDKNLMDGANEFRFFDIRTLRFFSNNVADKFFDSLTNVVLRPEELRSHLAYFYQMDYNGKRVVSNKDGANIAEDGDYALVHFYLKTPNPITMGPVYIFGELSDWQMQEKFKMTYLKEYGGYYCKVLLKQSYYNYLYVIWNNNEERLDYTFTEGNHFETENDYNILLYHRNPFYGYDELIGFLTLNSVELGRTK